MGEMQSIIKAEESGARCFFIQGQGLSVVSFQ